MRCEDVLNQLGALGDGELSMPEATELEAHLAQCPQCRAAADAIRATDAELRAAFATRRLAAAQLAERTATLVRSAAPEQVLTAPQPVSTGRVAWGQLLGGLAAGFLLALMVLRPWRGSLEQASVPSPTPPGAAASGEPIAHLAAASGPVEVWPAGEIRSFTCPTNGPIGRDATVRTGPSEQCEIALGDGNTLRLDCNTEVKLRQPELVEISQGRLSLGCQSGQKSMAVKSGGGMIVAKPPSELAVDCRPESSRLIVVDGGARVQIDRRWKDVGPGQQLRIVDGKLEHEPEPCDVLLETGWVGSVLALNSSEHPALVERVNRLLANVGAAKLSLLYEDELRRLGDDGVPPLVAYLNSTRSAPAPDQRATAARIVADVAQSRWIGDLIVLLSDPNPEVRFQAARGLERLTGRNQGQDARAWQSQPWAACQGAHEKWLTWWQTNRDRYPAARRDIPSPPVAPF